MPKSLDAEQKFVERIQIIARQDSIESLTWAAQRIAELTDKKKKYAIVDTYVEASGEQNYFLEIKGE